MTYRHIAVPSEGEKTIMRDGKPQIPDQPVVGFVEGDRMGPDIMKASLRVRNAAVSKAYGGKRRIRWCKLHPGGKAGARCEGNPFPDETPAAVKDLLESIGSPPTMPVGGGLCSPTAAPRQEPDSCVRPRPLRDHRGVPLAAARPGEGARSDLPREPRGRRRRHRSPEGQHMPRVAAERKGPPAGVISGAGLSPTVEEFGGEPEAG